MTPDNVDRMTALVGTLHPTKPDTFVILDAVAEILSLRGEVIALSAENRRLQGEVAEYDATAPTGLEYRGG